MTGLSNQFTSLQQQCLKSVYTYRDYQFNNRTTSTHPPTPTPTNPRTQPTYTPTYITHTPTYLTHTPTYITYIPVVDDPHGLEGLGFGWKGLNDVVVAPPPSAPKEDDPQGLLLPHWVSNPSRSSMSDAFGLGWGVDRLAAILSNSTPSGEVRPVTPVGVGEVSSEEGVSMPRFFSEARF